MKKEIEFNSYLACAYAEGFCEGENATQEEQLQAWAYIIKTKLYNSLQGFYGRTCRDLLDNGLISNEGVVNWDAVDDLNEL